MKKFPSEHPVWAALILSGAVLLLIIGVAWVGSAIAATPSTKFPGKSVPEVGDAAWGNNLRAWILSVDGYLVSGEQTSTLGTVTVETLLNVDGTADFAKTVDFGGDAKVTQAGYNLLYTSHAGLYCDTRGGRKTALTAGNYIVVNGWNRLGNSSGSGYAVATTGAGVGRITIGDNGSGTYRIQVQVAGTQSNASGANIEGCLFKRGVELGNAQDIRAFSGATDIGRLGAFGYASMAGTDYIDFRMKSSAAASFIMYRGNLIIERIGP